MSQKKYDICILGGTGFTGRLVVEEIVFNRNVEKVLILARSLEKLQKTVDDLSVKWKKTPNSSIKLGLCNVNDKYSLSNATSQCKILLNCVGPFDILGENVILACLEQGTDYLDIDGEPAFLNRMAKKYHEEAQKKGVVIALCCGTDSVPADVGAFLTQKELGEQNIDSIDGYFDVTHFRMTSGTFRTLLNSIAKYQQRKPAPAAPAEQKNKKSRSAFSFEKSPPEIPESGWVFPFATADPHVVRRSLKLADNAAKYNHFGFCSSLISTVLVLFSFIWAAVLAFLLRFTLTRLLVDKILVGDGRGPSEHHQKTIRSVIYFIGKGKGKITTKLGFPEGYAATAIFLEKCASSCLELRKKNQIQGGVHTPISAFGRDVAEKVISDDRIDFSVE